jgi:TrkA domain protein
MPPIDLPSPPEPQRLPGVGQRLDLVDEDGRPVTAVRRKDGRLEIHAEGRVNVLTTTQARALGALASGHFRMAPGLFERTEGVLGGIDFDWVTVPEGAWAAGLSIGDLALRQRTGTTIVAILRGSIPIVVTDPSQRIEVGDELVFVAQPGGRPALERYLARGS